MRLIVFASKLIGNIELRVNLKKRLTLILSASSRLVAIEVSGIAMGYQLEGSEPEQMPVLNAVPAKLWPVEARDVV
jgi:hypothetical protein